MYSCGKRKTRKAHCPECGRDQRVKTLFEKRSAWTYDNGLECIHEYFAFQCKGCDTTFFCRSSANSEDTLQLEDEKGNSFEDLVFRKEYFPTEGRAYFLLEVDPELADRKSVV